MYFVLFSSPGFYCVVAETEGRIVGSSCIDERSIIAGIGPIAIDPTARNLGVGRKLMRVTMGRARERHPAGMRLVQAAYHNRSLSLYASAGFGVREPLSCMQSGSARRAGDRNFPDCSVRPAQLGDDESTSFR